MTNALDERIAALSLRIQQLELATTTAGGPAPPGPAGQSHPLLASLKPSAAAGGLEAEVLKAERDKVRAWSMGGWMDG